MDLRDRPHDSAFRAEIRQFLDTHLVGEFAALGGRGGSGDETYGFEVRLRWERVMAEGGWTCLGWPVEHGGRAAAVSEQVIFHEEYARAAAPGRVSVMGEGLLGPTLIHYGTEAQKQRFLPPIRQGRELWCQGYSEPGAGSDLASVATRAVLDGDQWVLNGTKCWITNAGVSTFYTVMAVTEPGSGANGISAFVVHKDDPGFSVGAKERKLGIKGSPTCEIYFEDCTIPADRIIGEPGTGFKTALRTLDHTRLAIGAQALGIAQGALDAAIGYVKQRKQFGKRIADFQGIQFMLADMAMRVEASRQLVYAAAAKAERDTGNLAFSSSAAKVFASDTAMSVTTDAVQLFGGYGFTQDFPVERMMRDAKITQIYEGTNQINRMVMARNLLK
jgi:alkylation response protein AidB-like acyl-CoA dehydrogenase